MKDEVVSFGDCHMLSIKKAEPLLTLPEICLCSGLSQYIKKYV
jgi:hypothetical protein